MTDLRKGLIFLGGFLIATAVWDLSDGYLWRGLICIALGFIVTVGGCSSLPAQPEEGR